MNVLNNIFELYDTDGNPITPRYFGQETDSGFILTPSLTNKIRLTLLEKDPPELRLYGIVNEEMASYVRQALMFLDSKPEQPTIKAIITSLGGSVNAGLEIHSLLSQYTGGVQGFVEGYAYSAAAQLVLQGCLVRSAHKYAHLMCHFAHTVIYVGEHDLGGKNRLARIQKDLKNANDQAVEIIRERTGKEERLIRKFLCQGHYKTAKDYKEVGLIDSYYSMKVTQVKDERGILVNQSRYFRE